MSLETFKAALRLAERRDEYLVIGGGEPTVHPQFLEFLGLAIVHDPMPDITPLVITNGKRKQVALRLAQLARNGVVQAELSIDEWHDPVAEQVVEAFDRPERGYHERPVRDLRGIRTVRNIVPVGRAVTKGVATEAQGCCCENLLVDPEGRLFACGCKTIQLGTVAAPEFPEDYSPEWAHTEEAQEWVEARRGALAA